MIC
ncbi:unnamed protein product [Acanthoscelides obtectus]|jgi:hypothetical protein